jgi:predicted N-acetyltransferase YhbS
MQVRTGNAAMTTIRQERSSDVAAREALLDRAFGGARHAKTCERLRERRRKTTGWSAPCGSGTCRRDRDGRH